MQGMVGGILCEICLKENIVSKITLKNNEEERKNVEKKKTIRFFFNS